MDPSVWITLINESGLPLVGLVASCLVNIALFRITQNLHKGRLEDLKAVQAELSERDERNITAMHNQTAAITALTETQKEWIRAQEFRFRTGQ